MFIYIQKKITVSDQACYCDLTECIHLQKLMFRVPVKCAELCCKVIGSDFVVILTGHLMLDRGFFYSIICFI